MNPEIIPQELRHLLPYATRWGINCDIDRGHYFDAQPIEDILDFVDSYTPWADKTSAWLDTFDVNAKWPPEAEAYLFMNKAYCDAYFIAEAARTKK